MPSIRHKDQNRRHTFGRAVAILSAAAFASSLPAIAQEHDDNSIHFFRGNLIVSRSVYDNNPSNIAIGTILPPLCTSGCAAATNDGALWLRPRS